MLAALPPAGAPVALPGGRAPVSCGACTAVRVEPVGAALTRFEDAERAASEVLKRFPESEQLSDAKRIRQRLRAGRRTLGEIFGN